VVIAMCLIGGVAIWLAYELRIAPLVIEDEFEIYYRKGRAMKTTVNDFVARYCERQECEPDELVGQLKNIRTRFNADGFMLLVCHDFNSSRMGSYTILPFGGSATYQEVPSRPISPRGLASDMSVVESWIDANELEMV
jgi:hypothetical protein